jgi:single-strand DNA-binding protein
LRLSRWEDKETGEKRSTYGLEVDEVGPSLRFALAKVTKTTRTKADGFVPATVPDDPWSTGTQAPAVASVN